MVQIDLLSLFLTQSSPILNFYSIRASDLSPWEIAILHLVSIQDTVLAAIPSCRIDICGKQIIMWVYDSRWLLAVDGR